MPFWFAERRRIEQEVNRAVARDLKSLKKPADLLLAKNEAKQILLNIDDHKERLRRNGAVASTISEANTLMTITGGAVWAAAWLGVAVAAPLAAVAVIATPIGAGYAIADRARQHVRSRRLDELNAWYKKLTDHANAIDTILTNRVLHPDRPDPP